MRPICQNRRQWPKWDMRRGLVPLWRAWRDSWPRRTVLPWRL